MTALSLSSAGEPLFFLSEVSSSLPGKSRSNVANSYKNWGKKKSFFSYVTNSKPLFKRYLLTQRNDFLVVWQLGGRDLGDQSLSELCQVMSTNHHPSLPCVGSSAPLLEIQNSKHCQPLKKAFITLVCLKTELCSQRLTSRSQV